MSEEAGSTQQKSVSCGICPVAMLPPGVWSQLQKPSFKKRHPIMWWLGLALIFLAGFGVAHALIASEEDSPDEKLALVEISGPIMNVESTLAWLRKISASPAVRGVLLRVNSPGGGAAASQEIYAALALLAKKMPIVVSMGATAASGGLMVSMAGERIFANPSTITGSIGVRMDIPQLQGLMGKLGIGQETLTTGPYKDAASYVRPLTPEDRAYLENVIQNMHAQFVEIVARARKMELEQARNLANGKIYTGQQALELGLIDELGGQETAHAWLAEKTGVPQTRKLLRKPESKTRMLEKLFAMADMLGLAGLFEQGQGFGQPVFMY